jgi:hypothetical protein
MAAGLGFKTFTTGEVLTAADTNGYLMQGILVFASATARDAAITSPQEGQFAYLKDTNVTTYYTGSAWANVDTTGMTNPMTTTGDIIYSSSGSTPARLGIGTAGQVLKVNSGATAPEWAAPAGGGKVLQVVNATFSTLKTSSSDTWTDTDVTVTITPTLATSKILIIGAINGCGKETNSSAALGLRLMRGATQIAFFGDTIAYNANAIEARVGTGATASYLDNPATTSATTYKFQFRSSQNSAVVFIQSGNSTSNITVLEIGA